jgi:5'-nucleotidase/UDP-sugar diphosphatase
MKSLFLARFGQALAGAAALALLPSAVQAEPLTILHVGDQESWLISAQGNLRDDASQVLSFYGGVDRFAAVIDRAEATAAAANRFVIKLNAGDAFLPGPRLEASFANLASAYPGDGGQDFYDAIALRRIGFDAVVFGNHEFDLGPDVAARFAKVSETSYLSINLNFGATPAFSALQTAGQVAPSKIITTPLGKKVGIIGVTTPLLPTISSPSPVNLTAFNPAASEVANLQALLPVIQDEIDRLRNTEGVTVIVVMSHLQNAANERDIMVPGLTGVDLVVSGGGHELMADPSDLLISTTDSGVAPSFNVHPIFVNDLASMPTPIVTGHFGNRYVGEVNLTIDDTTGLVTAIDSTRMLRVSGRATDTDVVVPDAVLNAGVVQPVRSYIAALNAQIIGTTAVRLNGDRGAPLAPPTAGNYTVGVRNAETGLGNLVADAMRFAGSAQVAIQNGGGIRVSIAGPGNVSVGDTFNVLPFTNLVKRAPVMTATQLKDLLEHSVAASTATGSAQGRFAQVSGIKVNYDTTRPARTTIGTGSRIRRVVLDNGAVLVDGGVVQAGAPTFSFATIDFTANGGDGYPFAANGVVFENSVDTITYQQALADYIQVPKALGGLGRLNAADGDEITANLYGRENAFDTHGRLIDNAVAVATPGTPRNGTAGRDTLVGDANDNVITGGASADTLTGGAGGDTFVYAAYRDIGDTITDFTPYADKLSLGTLLASIGYAGSSPVADGYIKIADTTGGAVVQLDLDGAGPAAPRPIATLRGLTAAQIAPARDFTY